ncbi:MAG: hypothetical protein LBE67_03940 [Kocuria palustris]|nr:hypothetical protein [Kocuria palustris]
MLSSAGRRAARGCAASGHSDGPARARDLSSGRPGRARRGARMPTGSACAQRISRQR